MDEWKAPQIANNFTKNIYPPSDSEGRGNCVLLSVSDAPGLLVWNIYLHTWHIWSRKEKNECVELARLKPEYGSMSIC